ncbi:hypothetical protein GCM10011309_12850 [Litorimonas cladophorae]|uniref:Lipoprotein n=1 Tax=Litorimonas cladophorae TaxID=1220491 RepID=A0A918KIQ6_9PROT|nr:hypothetical protein [Litorimonas cladophorae]GGX64205.1 hypothetical protein GCM10011309_12850 [Litorimonas cladophorae]
MKRLAAFFALLLVACQSPEGSQYKSVAGEACEAAFKSLSISEKVDGHLMVSYKMRDGAQFAYSRPDNATGEISAVCTVNVYEQKIEKLLIDTKSENEEKVRKDFTSQISQELRTF